LNDYEDMSNVIAKPFEISSRPSHHQPGLYKKFRRNWLK